MCSSDLYWRISIFDLGISISTYLDISRDIHMQYLDIYMWITCSRCGYLSMGMDSIHIAIMTKQIFWVNIYINPYTCMGIYKDIHISIYILWISI